MADQLSQRKSACFFGRFGSVFFFAGRWSQGFRRKAQVVENTGSNVCVCVCLFFLVSYNFSEKVTPKKRPKTGTTSTTAGTVEPNIFVQPNLRLADRYLWFPLVPRYPDGPGFLSIQFFHQLRSSIPAPPMAVKPRHCEPKSGSDWGPPFIKPPFLRPFGSKQYLGDLPTMHMKCIHHLPSLKLTAKAPENWGPLEKEIPIENRHLDRGYVGFREGTNWDDPPSTISVTPRRCTKVAICVIHAIAPAMSRAHAASGTPVK